MIESLTVDVFQVILSDILCRKNCFLPVVGILINSVLFQLIQELHNWGHGPLGRSQLPVIKPFIKKKLFHFNKRPAARIRPIEQVRLFGQL
ncbi:hypothetical protein D3C80_995700 [compost metagenome]